ncbi:MAG: hypothetical protein DI598_13235, partial [Pseudopedobacter saltans]
SLDNIYILYPDQLFCIYNTEGRETLRLNLNTLLENGDAKGFCFSRDSVFFSKRSFEPTIVAYNIFTGQKKVHTIKQSSIHWLENIEYTENNLLIINKEIGFLRIDNRYRVQKDTLLEKLNKENNYKAYWIQKTSNGKWALIYKNGNIYELTKKGDLYEATALAHNFNLLPYYSRDIVRCSEKGYIVFNQNGAYNINSKYPAIKRLFYNSKPKLSTRNICINDNGYLYIGSYSGLVEYSPIQKNSKIYNKDGNPFESKKERDDGIAVPFALFSSGNYIYIGSEGYPFYRFNTLSKKFEYNFYKRPDFGKNRFFSVYVICPIKNTDRLLLGNNGGLAIYDIKSNEIFFLHISESLGKYNEVYAIGFYHGTQYLIGTKLGLYLLDLKDTTIKSISPVKDYTVNSIYIDKQSSEIWAGTSERGIIVLDRNLNLKKIIDSKSGLPSEQVVGISSGKKNDKWIATGNGISHFNGFSFVNYFKEDGLSDNELNRFSSLNDSNGHLYIGSINGVSYIDLDKVNAPIADEISISQISLWRSSSSSTETFTLTDLPKNNQLVIYPNDRGIKFSFGTSDISNVGKSSIMYRIIEISHEWDRIGEQRDLRFEGLPYGTLHLEIKSISRNNIESANTISYTLIVKRPFYLNWYFYVGLFILFFGIVFLFLYQKNLSFKKLAEQRVEISRTLHDELGVIITAIRFNIEAEFSKKERKSSFLNRIYDLSKKASAGIYESLWMIDAHNDTWGTLLEKFEEINEMVLSPLRIKINIDFNTDDNQAKISPLLRQQLFYIYKEAINNIVRHSKPENISITANIRANHFKFEFKNDKIKDNEIWSSGMGLQNIRHRASNINALVETAKKEGWFILKITSS